MHLETIAVPTDFSETADHATKQAVELAERHGARIELIHVVEPYGAPPPNMMAVVRDYLAELESEAQKTLVAKADAIREQGIEVRHWRPHHVAPIEGIADKIECLGPDLVVIGTHGRRGFQRFILGSVAERLLRSVAVNVLTLSKDAPLVKRDEGARRILVPIDFSEASKRALGAAFSLLADDGDVHVVHVVDSPIYPTFYPGPLAGAVRVDTRLSETVREHVATWLDGRSAEVVLREGDPSHEILETSAELKPDLVVMGTRGLRGLSHVLLGSVAERVVRRAPMPILTVH